jgi:hypothetical protein
MSGIFPNSGVPASDALNTVNVDTVNCGPNGELFHSTSRCQPRFDPAAANAVMSEILNLVAGNTGDPCVPNSGLSYDCSRLDNMLRAVVALTERIIVNGSYNLIPAVNPTTAQQVVLETINGCTAIRRAPPALTPVLRRLSGQDSLNMADVQPLPLIAPFQPGPGSIVINNPFNIPIVVDLEMKYIMQLTAGGDDGVRFEANIFIDGVPSGAMNATTTGPLRPASLHDFFQMNLRQFINVPALGSRTITHSYRVFVQAGAPVDPLSAMQFAAFQASWYGVGLELV